MVSIWLSGIVAAGFMILILLIIIGQMIARWLGFTFFEGSTEFAGYAMAATSFLRWHMHWGEARIFGYLFF